MYHNPVPDLCLNFLKTGARSGRPTWNVWSSASRQMTLRQQRRSMQSCWAFAEQRLTKLSAIWQPRGGRRITALGSWCSLCKLTATLHHQWLYSDLLLTPVHRRIVQQYHNLWRSFDSCQSPVSLTPRSTICCRTDWCVAFAAMSRCNASFWPSQISPLRKPLSLASPQKQPRRMPGNYSRVQSPKELRLWAIISRHDRRGLHHHPRVIDVMTSSIQPRTAASKLQNVTTAGRRATLWKFVAARTNRDSHMPSAGACDNIQASVTHHVLNEAHTEEVEDSRQLATHNYPCT